MPVVWYYNQRDKSAFSSKSSHAFAWNVYMYVWKIIYTMKLKMFCEIDKAMDIWLLIILKEQENMFYSCRQLNL